MKIYICVFEEYTYDEPLDSSWKVHAAITKEECEKWAKEQFDEVREDFEDCELVDSWDVSTTEGDRCCYQIVEQEL